MPRLLIAYDGSEASRSAVRAAGGLFPGRDAVVLFAHEEPPQLERVAVHSGTADPALVKEGLEQLTSEIIDRATAIAEQGASLAAEHGLSATPATVATKGGGWAEILGVATERNVDVVVCGTRGRGSLGRALLGSTATSLLHNADRPLLVVPDGDFTATGQVAIAYDGSEGAKNAVALAAELFQDRSAVVVYAWRSPLRDPIFGRDFLATPVDQMRAIAAGFEELTKTQAQTVANEGAGLAREFGFDDASADVAVTRRSAWRSLLEAAEDADASVVVSGARGLGGIASALVGSVSSALVSNAERPTLIVRPVGA
jgi:nucleotide-binding universal stress UspA family protein